MRIVHVSDCYAPRLGGIESQVRDLARHQAATGHEVHVITATPAEPEGAGEATGPRGRGIEWDDGVRIHRIDAPMPFDLPVNPNAPRLLRPLLHAINPDVVHVQAGMISPIAFDGVREASALRLPVLVTWHCMLNGIRTTLRTGIALTGWDREPIALSAVSAAAADQVATAFGGYCDVGIVPNGIDVEQWRSRENTTPGDARTGVPRHDAPLHVVATMRLAPRKRVIALLRILNEAASMVVDAARGSFPGIKATVLGSGPMEGAARRYLTRHQMDWVDLRGRVPRNELEEIYASAEVFVAPSTLESFGIAALEARTSGLAVVARLGTGVQEFVRDGVEGLLVEDDGAMAQALVRLATDADLLHKIRSHNLAHPPAQSWAVVGRTVEVEYRRAIRLREECEGPEA